MSRLTGWMYTLRALFRRADADREMADEIAFHVDRQARKHEARGLPSAEAREAALREFGGTTRWREEVRAVRGLRLLDAFEQDLRHTLRALRRDRAFASLSIVTLALAIGANAAMFGIIDRVLLRGPEHVVEPDQLVRVYVSRVAPSSKIVTSASQSYAFYDAIRDHASGFSQVATYAAFQLRFGTGLDARPVPVTYATPSLFALAGVRPAMGRFYTPDEDAPPAGQPVAVLGYGFWQRAFAGDSAVLGRSLRIDDREFTVVGVAPRGFTGVDRAPVDVWIPMSNRTELRGIPAGWMTSWRGAQANIVGRLAMPVPAAEAQLSALLHQAYVGPDRRMRTATVSLRPLSSDVGGAEPMELGVTRLLAGVALVMLLVAAANVTNLGLARAVRRRHELGIRIALGAGRWRIVRLMVAESVAIALVGAALGFALARWGGEIIRRALLPGVAWSELPADGRVLLWTVVTALVAGIVIGIVPAWRASGAGAADVLRGARPGANAGEPSRGTARTALQVGQLALSFVLLFVAALFVKSLNGVRHLDLGYDRDRVLAIDLQFSSSDSSTAAARGPAGLLDRYEDIRTTLQRVPGVARASVAFGSPLSSIAIMAIRVPGIDTLSPSGGGRPVVVAAGPDYFETIGTPIVRGRSFNAADASGGDPVVIVNETMAAAIWPGLDPIGRCIVFTGPRGGACARVVGVAHNIHLMQLDEPALSQCYVPWGQSGIAPSFVRGSMLLVRTVDEDPATVVPALQSALRRTVPDLRSVEIETLEKQLDPQVRPWRAGATLFSLFGAIVATVAAIGLFSTISYLVTQRTPEIGVRMALGAQRGQVLRLVLGNGVRTAAIGVVLGAAGAVAISRVVQPLLFHNQARDPVVFVLLALLLLAVAAMASLWPSWRATRVDPLLALRAE